MAFLGIVVPEEAARVLAGHEVPGVPTSTHTQHCTMLYLGKQVPIDDICAAIRAVFDVANQTKPFTCSVSGIGSFPANPDDGVPVIGRLDQTDIMAVREAVRAQFDQDGVPYSNKYPDYTPHVTLAYADEQVPDRPIDPVVWTCSRLTMWCGDVDDDGMVVEIPLGGTGDTVEAAIKVITAALHLNRS